LLLPALAARAQTGPAVLPSKVYRFEDLPVRTREKTVGRAVLLDGIHPKGGFCPDDGATHDGFAIESHQTQLAPGAEPHPPHRHKHEELFLLREGKLEVFLGGIWAKAALWLDVGQRTVFGPGGMAYVASNEEHGVRNVGDTPAHYFVIALGDRRR
jgi:quercetin dioxygenase-like cupin family protein